MPRSNIGKAALWAAFLFVSTSCSDVSSYEHVDGFSVSCDTSAGGHLSLTFKSYMIDGWQSAELEIIGDDDGIYQDWSATDFIATYNQITFVSNEKPPQLFTMTRTYPRDGSLPGMWAGLIRYRDEDSGVFKDIDSICGDPLYEWEMRD